MATSCRFSMGDTRSSQAQNLLTGFPANAKNQNWLESHTTVRGNPVRVYEGMEFLLQIRGKA